MSNSIRIVSIRVRLCSISVEPLFDGCSVIRSKPSLDVKARLESCHPSALTRSNQGDNAIEFERRGKQSNVNHGSIRGWRPM